MSEPKWLNKEVSTRQRSGKQEKKLKKDFVGRELANSGAKYGENDVRSAEYDIEAKTTGKDGYRVTVAEFKQAEHRTASGRVTLQIIEFEKYHKSLVVLDYEDFKRIAGIK